MNVIEKSAIIIQNFVNPTECEDIYMLSIVIPAYNEEQILQKTARTISGILNDSNIDYEIIFVNDGSKDRTWEVIKQAHAENPKVKGYSFSRNFGKEGAIFAGMKKATGDCVVFIDCDLQHPPEIIPQMYKLWEEGYEVVEGVKKSRGKEGILHRFSAKTFYKIMSSGTDMDMSRASDFKLLDRKAIDALLAMPERNVFFRALSSWVGFKSTTIEFDVREREAGTSKWSILSLIRYAVTNITSFSTAPMQIVTVCGLIFFCFSMILGIQSLYMYITGQAAVGFTTIILLLLIVGTIIMMALGIIGYYVSKIYDEIKGRPRYIISQSTENDES